MLSLHDQTLQLICFLLEQQMITSYLNIKANKWFRIGFAEIKSPTVIGYREAIQVIHRCLIQSKMILNSFNTT